MNAYYSEKLSSNNLKRCYDIAPPRVQQYLESEIDYVLEHISSSDCTLELGCGYGRVLKKILPFSSKVVGIDISRESLELAIEYTESSPRCHLVHASAEKLPFPNNSIDNVVCIQNGISAFKIDPLELITETVRITKTGGLCLFSSYSENFWESRLKWFEMQAHAGLIGEIDWTRTSNGVITCIDGFTATTYRPEDFSKFCTQLELNVKIVEIDRSSVFYVISV